MFYSKSYFLQAKIFVLAWHLRHPKRRIPREIKHFLWPPYMSFDLCMASIIRWLHVKSVWVGKLLNACIYIYIYIYIHTHTHTYVHIHIYKYTHIHKYEHMYIHTYTNMYIYIYICICIYIHIDIYIYMCVCVCVCVCV